MAINKKLIHFKNKENFDNEVANGNILDNSIVFIQDSKEISTHGTTYKSVNWSVLEPEPVPEPEVELITFTVSSVSDLSENNTFTAEKGMTWEEFLNSNYDKTISEYRVLRTYTDSSNTTYITPVGNNNSLYYVKNSSGVYVTLSDQIISGENYTYIGER